MRVKILLKIRRDFTDVVVVVALLSERKRALDRPERHCHGEQYSWSIGDGKACRDEVGNKSSERLLCSPKEHRFVENLEGCSLSTLKVRRQCPKYLFTALCQQITGFCLLLRQGLD